MTVASGFLSHATTSPDRTALVLGRRPQQHWSYRELLRGATSVATALCAEFGRAPEPGVRIALLLESGREFLEVFYGAALAGIPVMVLDPAWSSAELSSILRDAPPARLFRTAGPEPTGWQLPPATVTEVPGPGYPDRLHGRPPLPPAGFPGVPESAPFYVAFTSGSSGRPKGAVRSHRSWLRTFERTTSEFGIDATDRILLPGSLTRSHFLYGAVHGLHVGATVHLPPEPDPATVFEQLDRYAVTRLYLVPTMFESLLGYARQHPDRSFPQVRTLLSAGAKWPPIRRAQAGALFPNADAVEFYGATELSLVSVLHGNGDGPPESVGRPVDGVELSLRTPAGTEVGVNEIGRVHVRSDMLFTGYLSARDGGAPDRDGWFTVGDIGRLDEQGCLHLVGREAGLLTSGGRYVYPEEVEAALLRLAEIAEVAVVGLPDEQWGELVCAVVRWRGRASLSLDQVREGAAAHLSPQKCPQRVFAADELPYTAGGKIDRRKVRSILLDGRRGVCEVP
ncbi:AMP-binding protein [Kitasatospora sp. NPDC056138]|uniref:AMP-binding protein n=1 Tax=Kitasatospora sp. NPDC056138 TaxID=3345724 RepID=UPI0035DCD499